jgi:hypothetical protein
MTRPLAVALALLTPALARADASPVPTRHLPVRVTLTVDRDYPDHEFFLVRDKRVERIPLTPSNPVAVASEDWNGYVFSIAVYALPKAELAPFGGTPPPAEWFDREEARPFRVGTLYERGRADFYDNRDRIEVTYLLRVGPEGRGLVQLSENEGSKWVKGAWCFVCCGLPPLLLAFLGVRLARRLTRPRS